MNGLNTNHMCNEEQGHRHQFMPTSHAVSSREPPILVFGGFNVRPERKSNVRQMSSFTFIICQNTQYSTHFRKYSLLK